MFSFFQSKQAKEATAILRRLCDLTTDDQEGRKLHERSSPRYSRKIPVLIAPFWSDLQGSQSANIASTALATDISDEGVGLICRRPLDEVEIILGFLLALRQGEHIEFFRGHVRHTEPIGGGYYQVGVQLTDRLSAHEHPLIPSLTRVARAMLPEPSE